MRCCRWTNNWPSYYPYYWYYPFYYYHWYWYYPFYYYLYPTLNYQAGSNRVITGVQSQFSNTFRDRQWRFKTCQVSCRNGWDRSGTQCTCPYGSYLSGRACISSRKCGRGQRAAS
mgnify:CR=1 FL=1